MKERSFYQQIIHDKASQGIFGAIPAGYKRTYSNGKREIILEDELVKYVIDVFQMYASGNFSLDTLSETLAEKHSILMTRESMRRIIKNKFYIGIAVIKDAEYLHKLPQFISKDLWDDANSILASYRKKRVAYRGKFFLFRNLIICKVCTNHYTCETHKGFNYYHCSQFKNKEAHKERSYLNERDIIKTLKEVCVRIGANYKVIEKDQAKMRLFFGTVFELFVAEGKKITYKLSEEAHFINFKTLFLPSNMLVVKNPIFNIDHNEPELKIKIKKVCAESDPLLKYCKTSRSIDSIMDKFSLSLSDAQTKLFDLQLANQIIEDESGKWITIKK